MNPLLPPTTNSDSAATRRNDRGACDRTVRSLRQAVSGVVVRATCDAVRLKTRAEPRGQHLHRLAARPHRRLSRRITL
jgi:hypothetical protein